MKTKFSLTLLLFVFLSQSAFSQKLTVGLENGINFSNINGNIFLGKWDSQTGPVNGVYSKYSIGKWFLVQTGANFVSHYYNKIWRYYSPRPYPHLYYTNLITSPRSQYRNANYKFSFIRVPLLLKFKTPGKFSFELGVGPYYSFLVNDEFTGKEKEMYFDKMPYPENDWGWIVSTGINYSVSDRFEISLAGQITKGKETYLEDIEGKNGSAELTLGIGYNFFASKQWRPHIKTKNDSLKKQVQILSHSGITISKAIDENTGEKFSSVTGFTAGVSVEYILSNPNFSLISGMWYERKGFNLMLNNKDNLLRQYKEDTDIQIAFDYFTFPLLFNIKAGKRFITNVDFGFYYSYLYNTMARGSYFNTSSTSYSYLKNRIYVNDNVDQRFKDNDFGGIVGLRFEYPVFSETHIYLGFNYSSGFRNIYNSLKSNKTNNLKNSSFSMVLGFVFPSHKTEIK
jgi:hypothetical protein